MNIKTKFVVVTGGVISGIGKGVTSAALASLIGETHKVVPIKCDGYLNSDPGTINPIEHGEVYVLDDGGEVDMDFGHYERFLGIEAKKHFNITMGKVYRQILEQEREGYFLGKTVQLIPHVTDNIKKRIYDIAKNEEADIVFVEIGGTVGDMENSLFIESLRQMRLELGSENMCFVHLTYVPKPLGVNEQKSKPTQQSIKIINELGIYPDILIARSHEELSPSIVDKISLYCNIKKDYIFISPDVDSVYYLPKVFNEQGINKVIDKHFNIKTKPNIDFYDKLQQSHEQIQKIPPITIGICGKYTSLEDSYASITESLNMLELKHAINIKVHLIDTTQEEKVILEELSHVNGVIIPGGFGSRGIEGKIKVIEYVRKQNIPFLGICYGMQLAIIEFARNKCNILNANTREIEEELKADFTPVVELLEKQKNLTSKGGTMRLGGHDVTLKPNTLASKIFNEASKTRGRFRHRYEINPEYVPTLEENGMVFSGYSSEENIMQIVELPEHPFFLACQFHPELTSTLLSPSPLFEEFIIKTKQGVRK